MSADRKNNAKLKTHLFPAEWELELTRIFHQGSIKYSENNWLKGMPYSYCLGSARRHILKYLLGQKYDKETGCHHLAHAAWNLLAIYSYELRGVGMADLTPHNPTEHDNAEAVDFIPEFKGGSHV